MCVIDLLCLLIDNITPIFPFVQLVAFPLRRHPPQLRGPLLPRVLRLPGQRGRHRRRRQETHNAAAGLHLRLPGPPGDHPGPAFIGVQPVPLGVQESGLALVRAHGRALERT